jgi:hypothetical protein
MPAKSFLGFDGGSLAFDMGDGQATRLPATGDTVRQAMLLEQAAGRDPAAVLQRQGGAGLAGPVDAGLAAAIPPAPSAMGPTALAQAPGGPMVMPEARVTPTGLAAVGAPKPKPSPGRSDVPVGLANVGGAPPVALPQDQALDAATAAMERGAAGAKALDDKWKRERELKAAADSAGIVNPDKLPPASAQPGTGKPIPVGARGGPAAAGGGARPAGMSGASREYTNWIDSQIMAEANKRPTAGRVVKGGKVQTGETVQGSAGPDPALSAQQDWTERLLGVYQGKIAGIQEQAQAAGAAGAAAIEAKNRAAQEAIAETEAAELKRLSDEHQALRQEVAKASVDPNRWWKDRTTGEKATIGIGLFIGNIVRGLTGRSDKPDVVMQSIFKKMDEDVQAQIRDIDKKRGDLNDLQKHYLQVKDRFGSEKAALESTRAAALTSLQAQIKQQATQAQIDAGVDVVPGPDGEPMLTGRFSLAERMAQLEAQRAIDARQAATSAAMRGQIAKQFGFTQDRVVGGSSGGDPNKIRALYKERQGIENEQRELGVKEREKPSGADSKQLIDSFKILGPDGKEREIRFDPEVPAEVRAKIAERSGAGNDALKDIASIRDKRGFLGIPGKTYKAGAVEGAAHGLQLNYDLFQGQGQSNEGIIGKTKEDAKGLLGGQMLDERERQVRDKQAEWARQYGAK